MTIKTKHLPVIQPNGTLQATFASRTVKRGKITQAWLREHGIVVPPTTNKKDARFALDAAVMSAGYFIQDAAMLSIPSTALLPQRKGGTSSRDRAREILRTRSFLVGFEYSSKVQQPFAIRIEPPLSELDAHIITGGDDLDADGEPKRPLTPQQRSALAAQRWIGRCSLLTETAKMGCYSWNLPAGPPALGGTCPSASLGFMYSEAASAQKQGGNVLELPDADLPSGKTAYRLDPEEAPIDYGTFICNGCYALKGNYKYANQIVNMLIRQMLVQTLLVGTGTLAVKGVYYFDSDAYHAACAAGAKPDDAVVAAFQADQRLAPAARSIQPLATGGAAGISSLAWILRTAIEVADIHSTVLRSRKKDFDARSYASVRTFYEANLAEARSSKKKKPSESARASTEATYAWSIPEPGFFRIHDSGDFYSKAYWEAWATVMRDMPHTRFWAPNRTWAHASATVDPAGIPENLAMRPSALHFGDPPPTAATMRKVKLPIWKRHEGGGLAAGSGSGDPSSMEPVPGTPFQAFVTAPDEPFWECPAYAYWTEGGGAVFGTSDRPAGGTCILARGPNNEKGCRACWGGAKGEYTHVGVCYHMH